MGETEQAELCAGLAEPMALVVAADRVYVAVLAGQTIDMPAAGQIVSCPLTGGAAAPVAMNQQGPVAVALSGTDLFWVDQVTTQDLFADAAIMHLPLGASTATTLAAGTVQPRALAVDGQFAYYSDANGVYRVTWPGNARLSLSNDAANALAVDGSSLYWVDDDGALGRAAK